MFELAELALLKKYTTDAISLAGYAGTDLSRANGMLQKINNLLGNTDSEDGPD
jgi:hypothetical protein